MAIWAVALWWGGLTTVGFGVVPMLFAYLPTPAIAGVMAAKLFSALTWLAVVCGLVLLIVFRSTRPVSIDPRTQRAIGFIVAGMLLALLTEFAVSPRIVAREDLRMWHTIGTLMYATQWFCSAMALKFFSTIR